MNYTVTYDFDREDKFGKIHFDDQTAIMDLEDLFAIINYPHTFTRYTPDKQFPYYTVNYQCICYKKFIYKYNDINVNYVFKNGNTFDLRRSNVDMFHTYHNTIIQKYDVMSYHHGHISNNGKDACIMKNPIWRIRDSDKEYILMYCETDTICKLCPISYQKILDFEHKNKKIAFYKHSTGYIYCANNLSIHQIITGCYGNGRGTKHISVDHIDQDRLNNSFANLRIVTQDVQQQNSKGIKKGTKRARKYSAQSLPEEITESMLNKYVTYNKECYNKEKNLYREFFRVEKHPKYVKGYSSSKSEKVSIVEKLNQANTFVDNLQNDIYPITNNKMPTFISNKSYRGKPHLTFDRKAPDGQRQNLRMVLPQEYELDEQINIIREKIKEKYDIEI